MQDEWKQLEMELRSLRPRQPSVDFTARILERMAGTEEPTAMRMDRTQGGGATGSGAWRLVVSAALGLAAGLALWAGGLLATGGGDPGPDHQIAEQAAVSEDTRRAAARVPEVELVGEAVALASQPPAAVTEQAESVPEDVFKPVWMGSTLVGARDLGIRSVDGVPVRTVRVLFHDRYRWHNRVRNETLEVSKPRQQVVLVGVHAH